MQKELEKTKPASSKVVPTAKPEQKPETQDS